MTRIDIQEQFKVTDQDKTIAYFAAMAVGLSLIDLSIPTPIAGIKPGLANIVVLICLVRFGFKTAFTVAILRVLLTGLLVGTLFSPTFWLALTGSISSLLALKVCSLIPQKYLSVVSYSIIAAFFHIAAQIALISHWLIPMTAIYKLLPVFALFALITGSINGIATLIILGQSTYEDNI